LESFLNLKQLVVLYVRISISKENMDFLKPNHHGLKAITKTFGLLCYPEDLLNKMWITLKSLSKAH
jgi:hypothetical protein